MIWSNFLVYNFSRPYPDALPHAVAACHPNRSAQQSGGNREIGAHWADFMHHRPESGSPVPTRIPLHSRVPRVRHGNGSIRRQMAMAKSRHASQLNDVGIRMSRGRSFCPASRRSPKGFASSTTPLLKSAAAPGIIYMAAVPFSMARLEAACLRRRRTERQPGCRIVLGGDTPLFSWRPIMSERTRNQPSNALREIDHPRRPDRRAARQPQDPDPHTAGQVRGNLLRPGRQSPRRRDPGRSPRHGPGFDMAWCKSRHSRHRLQRRLRVRRRGKQRQPLPRDR